MAYMTSGAPAPYDPQFDPLTAQTPGTNQAYAPTYWVATAGPPPEDDGPVKGDMDVDVVVVGSGFTGLSCALSLAREHNIKATVLEANQIAWGCSTRNGGQGQNASGRLSRSQWITHYGRETALRLHAEILDGFSYFTDLVNEFNPDPQHGGHLYIAHRQRNYQKLVSESEVANSVFGYKTRMVSPEELRTEWLIQSSNRAYTAFIYGEFFRVRRDGAGVLIHSRPDIRAEHCRARAAPATDTMRRRCDAGPRLCRFLGVLSSWAVRQAP